MFDSGGFSLIKWFYYWLGKFNLNLTIKISSGYLSCSDIILK